MPLIGDKFPELEVKTTFGSMKLPDDFNGKWVVSSVTREISLQSVLQNS